MKIKNLIKNPFLRYYRWRKKFDLVTYYNAVDFSNIAHENLSTKSRYNYVKAYAYLYLIKQTKDTFIIERSEECFNFVNKALTHHNDIQLAIRYSKKLHMIFKKTNINVY